MSIINRIEEDRSAGIFAGVAVLTIAALGLILGVGVGHTNASSTTVSVREGSQITARDDQAYGFDEEGAGVVIKSISIGSDHERFDLTASNTGTIRGVPGLRVMDFDLTALSDGYLDQTQVIVTMNGQSNTINEARVTLREFVTNTFVMSEVEKNGNAVAPAGSQQNYSVTVYPASTAEGFTADDIGVDYQVPFSLGFVFSATDNSRSSDLGRYAAAKGTLTTGTNRSGLYLIPNDDALAASQGTLAAE